MMPKIEFFDLFTPEVKCYVYCKCWYWYCMWNFLPKRTWLEPIFLMKVIWECLLHNWGRVWITCTCPIILFIYLFIYCYANFSGNVVNWFFVLTTGREQYFLVSSFLLTLVYRGLLYILYVIMSTHAQGCDFSIFCRKFFFWDQLWPCESSDGRCSRWHCSCVWGCWDYCIHWSWMQMGRLFAYILLVNCSL